MANLSDILMVFPNVLKIGYSDDLGFYNYITLSITNNVSITKTQNVQSFPVTRRYQYLNGVTKDLNRISVSGIVVDDNTWGTFIDLAMNNDVSYRLMSDKREYVAVMLESFFDDETLLKIEDSQIGVRNNLIITSLTQNNSTEFENATEWSIEFTQIPIIETTIGDTEISTSNTIDPYTYYNYLTTKRPEGL